MAGQQLIIPIYWIFVCKHSGTRTVVNPPRQYYDEDVSYDNLNLADASVILLDGFVFSEELKRELLEARKKGTVIVMDSGSWKDNE